MSQTNQTVTVKTNCRKNFVCTWPGVGKVTIDENGEFESNRENAEILMASFNEFYIKGEEGKQIVPINKEESSEADQENEIQIQDLSNELEPEEVAQLQESVDEANEREAYKDSLIKKSRKELEDLCKMFPSSEWRGKNKEDLIGFLITKLED